MAYQLSCGLITSFQGISIYPMLDTETKLRYWINGLLNELINRDTCWWDVGKVQSMLFSGTAAAVFKLLLPSEPRPNIIFWKPEIRGAYGVRSAYKLYRQLDLAHREGECSDAIGTAGSGKN